MMRRSLRELSSAVPSVVLACALALACVAASGCKKDEKAADADAAAAADAAVAVADAAVAVVADAAVAAADAATAPLATTVAKPKVVDPPICAAARSAKQRNSQAAPGLEKQCITAGGTM